jgi:hypothetical protein
MSVPVSVAGSARATGRSPRWLRPLLAMAVTALAVEIAIVLGSVAPRFSTHAFADRRTMLGVPNFGDVVSNAAFLLVGALGVATVLRLGGSRFVDARERWPWIALFMGVMLVGVGSAYYHLAPDGDRLVWDRLPISIAFMSFFAAVVAERVSVRLGLAALVVLVPLGVATVFYWASTGDLRPYMVVQLGPMLLVPLLVLGFPARYTRGRDVLIVLAFYVVAKIAEYLDRPLLDAVGVSGHSLKHLIAGLGLYAVVVMLRRRSALSSA